MTASQAVMLLRAAGARRFAWNWAIAAIKVNADHRAAEATYDIDQPDRVRPLSYFTLGKLWTTERPQVAPWAAEHSTWTFRYALRDAANAHAAFLAGQRRFPKFKSRHRARARFTVRDGLALEAGQVRIAKYGWVRIAAPCPAQAALRRLLRRGHGNLQHITVSRHADGHWYATINYVRHARVSDDQRSAPAGPIVGLDRGVKTAAVVADANGYVFGELRASRALRAVAAGQASTADGVPRAEGVGEPARRRSPGPGTRPRSDRAGECPAWLHGKAGPNTRRRGRRGPRD